MSTPTGDQGQYGGQGGEQYGGQQQPGGDPQYQQQYGQPQYNPQQPAGQYGAQGYPGGPGQPGAPAPKNGLGIAALVLGILAIPTSFFLIGGLLGLIAIILGAIGLSRANKGLATNKGVSIAGIVTGVLGVIIVIALVVGGASFFFSSGGGDLVNCLRQAGQDTSAQQQCQQQFQDQVQRQYGG